MDKSIITFIGVTAKIISAFKFIDSQTCHIYQKSCTEGLLTVPLSVGYKCTFDLLFRYIQFLCLWTSSFMMEECVLWKKNIVATSSNFDQLFSQLSINNFYALDFGVYLSFERLFWMD